MLPEVKLYYYCIILAKVPVKFLGINQMTYMTFTTSKRHVYITYFSKLCSITGMFSPQFCMYITALVCNLI